MLISRQLCSSAAETWVKKGVFQCLAAIVVLIMFVGIIPACSQPCETSENQSRIQNLGRREQIDYPRGAILTRTCYNAGILICGLYSDGTDMQFTYDVLNRLLIANHVTRTRNANVRVTRHNILYSEKKETGV